ncbi:hypothetical protein Sste5346_006422 [Sporothrix stenoceras]|uniref:MFS monocarboxylate transporter n=1 Tax=Sporothrix stenoceras TaxID=5173 RepID=A0ABR3Z077_9PEZI
MSQSDSPIWPDSHEKTDTALPNVNEKPTTTATDTSLGSRQTHQSDLEGQTEDGPLERTASTAPSRHPSIGSRAARGLVQKIRNFIVPPPPPDADHAGPPPDGGFTAWRTVVCTHFVFANTWGFVNSFGIFQTYYADFLSPLPPSTISWIGSVQVFLAFFLSALTGRLGDAGYFRGCFWFGLVCLVAGVLGTSFATKYWQLILSQGVAVGLGAGFLCTPTMSIVTTYFSSKRSLALGVITCGNVSGGLVYPAMARQLLPAVGFGWTLRAMAFLQLALLVPAGLMIRPRVRPKVTTEKQPLFDWPALREPEYALYGLGMIFNIGGTFIVYYYVAAFGRSDSIHPHPLSYPESLNLLLIFNGIGIVGRMSAAYFADHVGPLNIVAPMAFVSALCCYTWIAVHDRAGVYGWISIYGMVAGALQALFPAGLTSLTTDMSKIGQRIGMGFTFIGVSVVAGPPAAGAMVTALHGRYIGAQTFAGSLLVVGGCLVLAAKVARMRRTGGGWMGKI